MEKEVNKVEKIETILEKEKKLAEELNKTIQELSGDIPPHMLEDLGYMYASKAANIAKLECMKKCLENRGLGNPEANEIFGIFY